MRKFTAKDFFEKRFKSNNTHEKRISYNENIYSESNSYPGLTLSNEALNKSHTMKSFNFNRNLYENTKGQQNSYTESLNLGLNSARTLNYDVMKDNKHPTIKLEPENNYNNIFKLENLPDLHGKVRNDSTGETAGGQNSDTDCSSVEDIIDPLDFLDDDLYRADLSNGGVDLSFFLQPFQPHDVRIFESDFDQQSSSIYSGKGNTNTSLDLYNTGAKIEHADPVGPNFLHVAEYLERPDGFNSGPVLYTFLSSTSNYIPEVNFSNVGSLSDDLNIPEKLPPTIAMSQINNVRNSMDSIILKAAEEIVEAKPHTKYINHSTNAILSPSLNAEIDIKPTKLLSLNVSMLSSGADVKPDIQQLEDASLFEMDFSTDTMKTGETLKSMTDSSDPDIIGKLPFAAEAILNELKVKLKLPLDVPLEFINGGYGVKNPLSSENSRSSQHGNGIEGIIQLENSGRFACAKCGSTYANLRLCKRHKLRHSEVKRYLCTICGKGFNDTFDLKRHTRTHTGVRPYKCKYCVRSFSQQSSLEFHCMKVHNIQKEYGYNEKRRKIYVCEECGHSCEDPKEHFNHIKDKHPLSQCLPNIYDKRQFKLSADDYFDLLVPKSEKKLKQS